MRLLPNYQGEAFFICFFIGYLKFLIISCSIEKSFSCILQGSFWCLVCQFY